MGMKIFPMHVKLLASFKKTVKTVLVLCKVLISCSNFDSALDTWVNLTLDQPFTACEVVVTIMIAIPHRDGPSFAGQNQSLVCTTTRQPACFLYMYVPQQK